MVLKIIFCATGIDCKYNITYDSTEYTRGRKGGGCVFERKEKQRREIERTRRGPIEGKGIDTGKEKGEEEAAQRRNRDGRRKEKQRESRKVGGDRCST